MVRPITHNNNQSNHIVTLSDYLLRQVKDLVVVGAMPSHRSHSKLQDALTESGF